MKAALWLAGLLGLALVAPAVATAGGPVQWPDTSAAIAVATARIRQLQQELMNQPSATLVLARWCGTYHLAPEPRILARRVPGPPMPLPDSVRLNLVLRPGEHVAYRRVQLLCGDHVLSDADNWYVPDRLTPAMNERLDHTDTPFGSAVSSLHFKRRTLSSETLWIPPRPGSGGMMTVPDHLLRNGGLLTIAGGLPISEVVENYTAAVLGTPP